MESLQLFLRNLLVSDTTDLRTQAETLVNLLAIAWGLHAVNWAFAGGGFNQVLCIRPRQALGLLGIIGAHFSHSVYRKNDREVVDGSHIVGNTLAFAPLGWMIALQGIMFFSIVSIAVALSSGLGTWLFGREGTRHVGASGVVFGYVGFLLVYGIVSGQLLSFLLAVVVLFLYRRILVSLFPSYQTLYLPVWLPMFAPIKYVLRFIPVQVSLVSWEMHLFGFLGGAFMGLLLSDVKLGLR